jgi:NAD(P)-dependent dehydrogenase (short-subunit alcohol dehydrogenase family)
MAGVTFDQRDIAAVRAAAEQVRAKFGGLDILFANGRVQGFKPLLEMADDDWHTQVDVNLNGTANVLRVFAPMLVERGGGRIIVTSSTQGRHDAAAPSDGGLAAVVGLRRPTLEPILARHAVSIAIVDDIDGFVVGGARAGLEAACQEAAAHGARRTVSLPVAVPSHT